MDKFTYHICFSKKGWIRYISHLDLLRFFNRALRRTGLKFYLTKGFNPRPIVRIKQALKLGVEAENIDAEIVLEEHIRPDIVKSMFAKEMPEGVDLNMVMLS
ncbi:MAG: TIGR03936 family radical SAM-associated protein [Candidatus Omnitrophota bacterium]